MFRPLQVRRNGRPAAVYSLRNGACQHSMLPPEGVYIVTLLRIPAAHESADNTDILQVGPVLDVWGPRFISTIGCGITVLGLVLFGVSHSGGFDAFVAASLLFSESTLIGVTVSVRSL